MGKHYVKLTELTELLTAQAVNGYIERGDVVKCLYSAPSIGAAKLNSITQQKRPRIYKAQDFTGNVINYRHNGKIGKFISPLRLKLTEMGIDISQVKRGERAFGIVTKREAEIFYSERIDGVIFDEYEVIFAKGDLANALGVSKNTITRYFKMGLRLREHYGLYSKYWEGQKSVGRYYLLWEIIDAINKLNCQ